KYGLIEYGAITWTPLEAYHLILNDYIAFLANKLQSSENETLFSDSGRLYYISRYKRKKAGPCFISVTKNEIFLKFKGKTLIIPIEKAAISIEIKSFIKIYLDYKIKDDFSQLLIKFAPTVSILKYFVTKQFLAYYHEGKIDLGDKKSYENLYFGL
ncbi:MAG: hypothetical protein LBR37_04605, partial [Erysipelotrichaceae bacterium]|nr:hypothetical protein [Erysipelotrichaceae bacterium]